MKPLVVSLAVVSTLLVGVIEADTGSRFHAATPVAPSQWSNRLLAGTKPEQEPVVHWWTSFNDPVLDKLVVEAFRSNYDLRAAAERVQQARAGIGSQRSGLFPSIQSSDSVGRQRLRGFGGVRQDGSPRFVPVEVGTFQSGFDLSWELDLFGRIRSGLNAAKADLQAQEEDRRDLMVTLLGDVALQYADLRGYQLRLEIARNNIVIQQDTVSLTEALAKAGQSTERDVAQALGQLESTRAAVPQLESQLAASMRRLAVLTGKEPGSLLNELEATQPVPPVPPDVPLGLPSDLLKRRPDVRRAQAQYYAQTYRISQARAEYFPKFLLSGSAARQSNSASGLTLGGSNIFAIGPAVSLPLFTGGRIRSNVELQNAKARESEARYQQAVLLAVEDTETSLNRYEQEKLRLDRLKASVDASRTALELSRIQYNAGLTDFLTVLTAQRDLYSVEDQLAQSRITVTKNLISVYKALGGGWQDQSAALPTLVPARP